MGLFLQHVGWQHLVPSYFQQQTVTETCVQIKETGQQAVLSLKEGFSYGLEYIQLNERV